MTTKPPKIMLVDLFADLNLYLDPVKLKRPDPAELAPPSWREFLPPERELLSGLGLHVMEVHGPYERGRLMYLVARYVETLRATWTHCALGGHGHDLSGYYEADDELRERWRRLDHKLQSSSVVRELLERIAQDGDLEASLLRRRDVIDAQLARLRGRRPPAKVPA